MDTLSYSPFPVIDIISSQIYCDYLEENQNINFCLREELNKEFEGRQIYTILDNDDVEGYGDGNVYGFRDGDGDGYGYVYGDGSGYGYDNEDGEGSGFGDGDGDGDGEGYGGGYGN